MPTQGKKGRVVLILEMPHSKCIITLPKALVTFYFQFHFSHDILQIPFRYPSGMMGKKGKKRFKKKKRRAYSKG
jgi:hypothetical protein